MYTTNANPNIIKLTNSDEKTNTCVTNMYLPIFSKTMLPCVLLLVLLLLGPVRGLKYEDLPSGTIWLLSPNSKIAYIRK